ncbi:MAG TPA: LysE family transporter [Anaerolineaceae bacterium]|nr:LysE family transporter [Anaerolineaceae bacterium]
MFFLTQGIIFGLYAAFLPGPMQAFLLSQILRSGWKKTLPLALIPLASDGPVMISLFFLLSQLPVWFTQILRIVGGIFILYLAWDAYQTSRKKVEISLNAASPNLQQTSFLKGVTMNLLNPNVYIFWATIGVPTILTGWQISPWHGISFALGFYATMIPVTMFWIMLLGTVGYLKPAVQKIISWVIVLLLTIVGFTMIISGISSLV